MGGDGATIFALSSGRLPAGVAVVRVSGPRAGSAIEALGCSVPPTRNLRLRRLRGADGEPIDHALVCIFPGPESFTGEDCVEIQTHGSPAVLSRLLGELGRIDGLRHAEPGEFTLRALLNGRLDLVEAEALADLISSETEAQRRFALQNAQGAQQALYDQWRSRLIGARAAIEADLDFSDQDDVPGSVAEPVWQDLRVLVSEMDGHLAGAKSAEILRDGFRVAIVGPPNVGKSSLLNAIARRDVAIVTEHAGTTRDILETDIDLHGYKVTFADTAGLRETHDPVERIGVERARSYATTADLVLHLTDDPANRDLLQRSEGGSITVLTKADLRAADIEAQSRVVAISSVTGDGIDGLLEHIADRVRSGVDIPGSVLPFRERHVALVGGARSAVWQAVVDTEAELEVRAELLRNASDALGRITGAIHPEEILGEVFSRFCIGK